MANTMNIKELSDKVGEISEALNDKMDRDIVNTNAITNCILEDPQVINLELSEGTLTLKAGSVVVVPNGFEEDGVTPKFDEVTIEEDVTEYHETTDVTARLVYYFDDGTLGAYMTSQSGSSGYTGSANCVYYNTSTNRVNLYISGVLQEKIGCFPIAQVTANGTVTYGSVDQVFQSIGYIGSTVFARKGLKVLIPNGRNDDGSLKNMSVTVSSTNVDTLVYTSNVIAAISWEGKVFFMDNDCEYDIVANRIKGWGNYQYCSPVARFTNSSNVISNFKPYTATNILKYADKADITGWFTPSDKYIDLTLGASGATYTAPANGWILLTKRSGSTDATYVGSYNDTTLYRYEMWAYGSTAFLLTLLFPVKKGHTFPITYSATGTTEVFRFIYAQGEV